MDGGGLRQMRVRVRGRGVRGRGVCVRGGGVVGRAQVSDEIRATVIDHVINHGLSLREAGQRVQPVLNRNTVASIVRIFRHENRGKIFSAEQEAAVVNMVVENNAIRLREIREAVTADQGTFREHQQREPDHH
ncbi:Matrix protein [Labeo rohita]|uniref:Matrix protein n=1 Tax=Labeo rohita TaxID=84645 RepID=A0ABQ8KZ96_LABRO|nr:Matrix protein [Labeo rohita]